MSSSVFVNLVSSFQYLLGFVIFAVIVYLIVNEWTRYDARIKGLPGPPGLPVVGNLHQVLGFTPLRFTSPLSNLTIDPWQTASRAVSTMGSSVWTRIPSSTRQYSRCGNKFCSCSKSLVVVTGICNNVPSSASIFSPKRK